MLLRLKVQEKIQEKMNSDSDSELVRQFTKESGTNVPNEPQLMNKEEVLFLIKMMLDEIMELGATVAEPHEVKLNMIKMITNSKDLPKITGVSTAELIAEQGDALVDSYYYSLNAAAKKGVNLSNIFKVVHQANMDKRDPVTGRFLKREDGKIIKPTGWKEPDITGEIVRQIKEGSFEKKDRDDIV
jgi:predicted HAD superfamily Cof-like phosphohydrolase